MGRKGREVKDLLSVRFLTPATVARANMPQG